MVIPHSGGAMTNASECLLFTKKMKRRRGERRTNTVAHRLSETKVDEHERCCLRVKEEVARLDVAVDHRMAVQMMQRLEQRLHVECDLLQRQMWKIVLAKVHIQTQSVIECGHWTHTREGEP